MIGLVFVSHSAKLAEGVKEIAEQMTRGRGMIAVAGGIDDPENPFGTDPVKVQTAIESVYSDDGVLVLMDLGSALLSAEMALELLGPEQAQNVKLCAAPLVEGAVIAAAQASIGASLADVTNETLNALTAKQEQLASATFLGSTAAPHQVPAGSDPEEIKQTLTILNPKGLHARPAADFVNTANLYRADIIVTKGPKTADAKSINQMSTLGAGFDDQIIVRASGPQAPQAVAALKALTENKFGEEEKNSPVTPEATALAGDAPEDIQGAMEGIPASPGIAVGPVVHHRSRMPEVETRQVQDTQGEIEKFQAALCRAKQELEQLKHQAAQKIGTKEAAIFDAQKMFLDDPALRDAAKKKILTRQLNAEAAWREAIDAMTEKYRELEDLYLHERAADVIDVGRRVLRHLIDHDLPPLTFDRPVILLAQELTPSDTVQLNPDKVLAICTALGGGTSHSTIVAKALGIPAIVGLGEDILTCFENKIIAVDGTRGLVWPHPTQTQLAEFKTLRDKWINQQQQAKVLAQTPASTMGPNPRVIEVVANIGGPHDTKSALDHGADGVGLFRTEYLFLGRSQPPSEAEQFMAYCQVADAMQTRPLVIRTLDVGADKAAPYLDMAAETNPFLGLRGIRFCLAHPQIFKTQLRAILKAGNGHNIKIMFPMISTPEEFDAAKAVLGEVAQELKTAGTPFDKNMEVGLMIEVPSAVAVAGQLAGKADFFSIGSNDLTQYMMGADRGNRQVSHLVNALHPAVLRMVDQTARAARKAGIWVGICGELAGNPLAAPVLIGLGLDELSMSAPNIPGVKTAIRHCTVHQAEKMAQTVLNFETAQQVETYLKKRLC
jgi:phosphocarrier protein FPr